MKKSWRRFEVFLPLQFNDGRPVPKELLGDAALEIVHNFGGATYEAQPIRGFWLHQGTLYREKFSRVMVDFPDTAKNRQWMREYKARWRRRLEQIELWMVSFRIDIE